MMKKKIIKTIKENPNCFLYYHDSGSWTIYKSKKLFIELEKKEYEEYDAFLEKITLLEGDDFGVENVGYAPVIVVALAEMLGIEVDSI